jgi:tetratricopeptide (TPR) repeat protein
VSARPTPRPRLYISQEPGLDLFSALEFGRVDDGQPSECWAEVGEQVGLLHDEPDGRCVGFVVQNAVDYDPDDPEHASLWESPRFDVPALGLTDVPPNAVVVAARALFGAGRTVNRELFSRAIDADGEAALQRWMRCLQAGDSMAHFALGYTLFELGRIPEAYRHLRHYSEIAPGGAWTWCWLGRAAAAMGEIEEARAAYLQAIAIDEEQDPSGEEGTDASELLDALNDGQIEVPVQQPSAAETWTARLEALLHGLRCSSTLWVTGGHASVLFDTEWVPVRADVDRTSGAVQLQAQIGVTRSGDDVHHLFDKLETDGDDVHLDEDTVWLSVPAPQGLAELDARLLELLVRGASATAARLFDAMTDLQPADDPPLTPPPTYDEVLAMLAADEG